MTPFQKIGRDHPPELNAPFLSPPAGTGPTAGREPKLVFTPVEVVPERGAPRGAGRSRLYSPALVSIAAYLVLGWSAATSTAAWVATEALELRPEAQAAANQAGVGAVWVMASALLTLIVNAIVADRKAGRESAERLALSETRANERAASILAESERKLREAREEADRKIALAKQANEREVSKAKAEADAKNAALEVRLAAAEADATETRQRRHDQLEGIGTVLNRLWLHADANSHAVNNLIPAVVATAIRAGVTPPEVVPVVPISAEVGATRPRAAPESKP